jgi:hypothetical protein
MGFLEDLVTAVADGFVQLCADIVIAMVTVLFGVSPLRTEGPFPFGQPIAPEIVGPQAGMNGGLLGYMAKEVYPKVSIVDGGEIIIFAIMLYIILQSFGGYILFFDPWSRDPDPTDQRDPVMGFFLMLFWFPIYYGFLSLSHYAYLYILPDPAVLAGLVTTIIVTSVAQIILGVGTIFLVIAPILLLLIGALMMIRAILAASFLLFGPVFIAIGWSNIPTASEKAIDLLKYAFGLALAPLPLPIILWIWGFLLSPGIDFPGLALASAFAQLSQSTLGLVIFDFILILSLILSWMVFKKTGGYIDKVGGAAMRVGSSAGIYRKTGDVKAAQQALRYGPGKAATRQAFRGFDDDGDGNGRDVDYWERLNRLNPWDDDGKRD